MAAFARHADEVGFESLLAVEHVAVPVGYESRYPYSDTGRMPLPETCELPDPLDLLAWLAARTERLRLGTGILVLPEHHPLQLAKRCATIDRLSGGRLFLGVGRGLDARGGGGPRASIPTSGAAAPTRASRRCGSSGTRRSRRSPASTSAFGPVRSHPKPVQATDPDPRRRPQPRRGPARRTARRRLLPAGPLRRAPRPALGPGAGRRRSTPDRDPASVSLTLGGLLGDDAAITDAVDARRRARRPVHPHRRPRRAPPRHGRRRRPGRRPLTAAACVRSVRSTATF